MLEAELDTDAADVACEGATLDAVADAVSEEDMLFPDAALGAAVETTDPVVAWVRGPKAPEGELGPVASRFPVVVACVRGTRAPVADIDPELA